MNTLLKRRRHQPILVQGQWLASVVRGHLACYALPGNIDTVTAFLTQVTRHWFFKVLAATQPAHATQLERMNRLAT